MKDVYVAEVSEFERNDYAELLLDIGRLAVKRQHSSLDSLIRAVVAADRLIRIAAAGRELFPDYYSGGTNFLKVTSNIFAVFGAEISASNLCENFNNNDLNLEQMVYETVIAKLVDDCREFTEPMKVSWKNMNPRARP